MKLSKKKLCPLCKSRMMWRDREACSLCKKYLDQRSNKKADSKNLGQNVRVCFRCGVMGKIPYGEGFACGDCLKIQYAQNLPICHRRPAKRVWWNRETEHDNIFEDNCKVIEHW